MIVNELRRSGLTISMDGDECEQMAAFLNVAAERGTYGGNEADTAGTMAGFFLAAALVCKTYGYVNLPPAVEEKLDAIKARVYGEDEREEDAAD